MATAETVIGQCADFEVNGTGRNPAWQGADWLPLTRVGDGPLQYATRAKLRWSETALYALVACDDARLSCSIREDNANIFTEDVVELFLQPDEAHPLYFEYEVSPLGVELPILVANCNGKFHGWLPWHYEGERKVRKAVTVRGPAEPGAAIEGWTAEFAIPFALFSGVCASPRPGDRWRGNVYRIDYDSGAASQWAWATATGPRFHEYTSFGHLLFG